MNYWDESVRSSLRPLKHCCHVNPAVLPETTDPDWEFVYIDIGSVSLAEGVTHKERMRFAASPSRARKPVREGDILVSTVRTYLKAIAAIEPADTPQVASTGFAVLRANEGTDARFLYRVVQSNPFVEQVVSQSTGVSYPAINPSTLSNIEVPLPDLATQRQIADFLDRETARIDLLIEKKQRLAERLEEEKDARITHEVTGNTREHSDRKPSRNAFISSIPALWNDAQLKHVVRPGTVITYGIVQAGPEYEGGIPYIRTGDMKGEALPLSDYPHTSPEIAKSYSRSALERGDLVMAIRATVGKCLRVPDELVGANLTQGTAKISPGPRVRRDYLYFALKSKPSLSFFDESAKGATFKEITLDRLRRLVIPMPPLDEQDQIVRRLLHLERRHSRVTEAITASIDRLREYRSALITAAVTGQIDVETYAKSGTPDRRLDAIQEEMGA
ncbi:restriction endonuclease subunit S [Roseobacter sp. YSTF-M11]|uniref:Restriction endonuclease subunit S n=1 Tax=Roseobacter insulae TaxID=2859783 RepID=A0A9X1K0F6_9RHOB|nr:restriction endonuclease subunit S [Roseobacter insulae]MBW4708119.1 restriction endonuclease subunit S [Roseobacter insulae]